MPEPILQRPGAGLPWFEKLVARHFIMPRHSRKSSWEDSLAQFEGEGRRILQLLAPLSPEDRTRRVLIERFRGIEDSSRYWSVAMTVEHLMIVGEGSSQSMVLLSQGVRPPVEVRIENVKPKGALDPMALDGLFAGFLADYRKTLTEKIVDRASRTTLHHPWLGPMTAAQWNWLMGSHQAIHRKQIWKILKASGRA